MPTSPNRGAEKISAEEVENHILAHPLVENCAFVAMPDPVLGEKGCAYVVTKGNQPLTLKELTGFLRDERHIAIFKLPERVELLAELPMTKVGKIDKKELRRMIADLTFPVDGKDPVLCTSTPLIGAVWLCWTKRGFTSFWECIARPPDLRNRSLGSR